MSRIGYIRTSTEDQLVDRQVNQLRQACDRIYIEDGVSARRRHRPVYEQGISELQRGDVLVVSSPDRAFRSSLDALTELEELEDRGIQFISLSQGFDTATPDGKFLYTLAAALAAWERDILSVRTKQGLEAARRRGKSLGRPRKLNEAQIAEARHTLETDCCSSITQVAQAFHVHERTLRRALDGS